MRSLLITLLAAHFSYGGDVTTGQYNNSRTGATTTETTLTQSNLGGLHWKCNLPVTGQVLAQPLVYSGVAYLATASNYVYAYRSTCPALPPVWQTGNLGAAGTHGAGCKGTPVINTSAGVLFVLCAIDDIWELFSFNLADGSTFHSPVTLSGTASGVTFSSIKSDCHTALLLSQGNVYIGCNEYDESGGPGTTSGFVFCYSATTLASCGIFSTEDSPTLDGGVWMSGGGISADGSGNVYISTGNGDFNGTARFGESMVKLSSSLSVLDYLTPSDWDTLNAGDTDFGGGRPILIGSNVLNVGKDHRVWLAAQSSLGHVQDCNSVTIIQCFDTGTDAVLAGSMFAGESLYVGALFGSVIKRFSYDGSTFNTTSTTSSGLGEFRVLAYSSNADGAGTGLLWGITSATHAAATSTLRASNSTTLAQIWNSDTVASDRLGTTNCCVTPEPTIANGLVYVATLDGVVKVYGIDAAPDSSSGASGTVTLQGGARLQ